MRKFLKFNLLTFFIYLNLDAYLLVKLPSKKILTERFNANNLAHFNKETQIIEVLAKKEITTDDIKVRVDVALFLNYERYLKKLNLDSILKMRSLIIELVLRDNQEALKEICEMNKLDEESVEKSFKKVEDNEKTVD